MEKQAKSARVVVRNLKSKKSDRGIRFFALNVRYRKTEPMFDCVIHLVAQGRAQDSILSKLSDRAVEQDLPATSSPPVMVAR
jgi:hypothetical protein